jgi:uncharacterized protein involved in response to NO
MTPIAPVDARPAVPWLGSAFRPFHLLGAAAAVVFIAGGALAWLGLAAPIFGAWHAHEMVFGFALAVIAGTLLTALPSWAGTPPVQGRTLALLVAAWLAGRAACAGAAWLPSGLVAVADLALPVSMIVLLAPQLLRVAQRRYLLVVVVLCAFAAANGAWHFAHAAGDAAGAARALRAALWTVVVLFTLAGGLFTPAFTANVLAERGRGAPAHASLPLEVLALAATVALAAADVAAAPPAVVGSAALAAIATQGWRVARWRGWRAADEPLVAGMHLGFVWLLAALVLKAGAALGAPWPEATWVHAFTVGALGSMKIALMTRVALRHTGRALVAPRWLPWLLLLASAAAAVRVGASMFGWPAAALALAAALWGTAFAAWLAQHSRMLVTPSLRE